MTMNCIEIEGGSGPAEALKLVTRPRPEPGPGQVLIRVAAAGVNRPDILQRRGHYPPPPGAPQILGLEVAGEIVGLGEGADPARLGQSVVALLPGGGYAEYAVADQGSALPLPPGLSMIEGAGLPETVFTVFSNVFEFGKLQAGETLLLHGATSGIGVTAIQLAKAAGARVIACGRGADKAKTAKTLGADISVDTTLEDWVAVAKAAGGADVILDMLGGAFTATGVTLLRPHGRLVVIAVQAGASAEIDLTKVLRQNLTVTGSALRPRPPEEKARLAAAVHARVWPWIEQGRFRPVIAETFPLAQAAAAHARLESGETAGKIILTLE